MIKVYEFMEWIPFALEKDLILYEGEVMVEPDLVNGDPIIHDIKFISVYDTFYEEYLVLEGKVLTIVDLSDITSHIEELLM